MRVALITFHNPVNYGAVLQCYAMCQVLQGLGHEVQVLDYHRPSPPPGRISSKSWVHVPRAVLRRVRSFVKGLRKSEIQTVFADFLASELPISSARYVGVESLRLNPPDADAYLCGSDQIWNDRFWYGFDEAYFLRFGEEQVRRIAYAPGVPGDDYKNGTPEHLCKLILGLDSVSAREVIGQKLIKQAANLDVPIVADPTILFGDFEDLLRPVKGPDKYILTYLLPTKDDTGCSPDLIVDEVASASGLPVVSASLSGEGGGYSPFQWLWLIRHSECFVTNSYHGLIFALLFKRQVFVLPRDGKPEGQDARMLYLLERYGLQHRYVKSFSEVDLTEEIDWTRVQQLMEEDRKFSREFLVNALSSQK